MSEPSDRARAIVDGLGLLLLATYVALAFAAARNGGEPWPLSALLLASALGVVVGRALGNVHRALVPAAVIVAAVAFAVVAGPLTGGGPLEGPFGYRNATGAFCVQAAAAGLMFAASVQPLLLRGLGIAAAAILAVTAVTDSAAAGMSLVALAVVLIGFASANAVRLSVLVAAALPLVTLVVVVALAATYRPGGHGLAARALTERRLVLWHESLEIIARHPGGVGPARFQVVSPTAIRDADARWAHDEFLQQGVELGWAGITLALLVFAWAFARLWLHPAPDVIVSLGAAALAALGIHACVDYVLHFPAVTLTAAALVGTAQSAASRRVPK